MAVSSQSDEDFMTSLRGEPQVATGVCQKHGEWTLNTFTKYPDKCKICPRCRADADSEKERREAEAKAAAAAAARRNGLLDSGVSVRHMDKTFDAFIAENDEQRTALGKCMELANAVIDNPERQPSIIMNGKPGTGKTHLACAMAIAVYDGGRSVCRISAGDLVREFKDSWRKGSEFDERRLLSWYGSIDLLVIEEIGVQFGSDTERMFIFEVVNRRYENCLPTVLVSNLDIDKLRTEVGERVIDRLREGGGRMLKFSGESWRKQ